MFDVVRRGYDRDQVEVALGRLDADLAAVAAERDQASIKVEILSRQLDTGRSDSQAAAEAAARVRSECDGLRVQVAELSTIPHTVDGMSERLQQMVRIAQDEVHEMRSRATTNASHVLGLAQAEADELRERSANERREFEAERTTSQESLRAQLAESKERLDQLRKDSDGQKARFDSELAERRSVAEEALAGELQEKRDAFLQDLASHRSAQSAEAARIVDAAAQEARNLVADAATEARRLQNHARNEVSAAQQELDGLRTLQHQVSEQLTSVRALLDWTLPRITTNGSRPPAPAAAGPAGPDPDEPRPAEPARPPSGSAPRPRPTAAAPDVRARPPGPVIPAVAAPTR